MSDLAHIVSTQQPLLDALARAARGELAVAATKPFGSVFGVYPQRNDLVMARIRITGGVLPLEHLRLLAHLAPEAKPGYIHLTSRQAIQFHDLTPAAAALVVTRCTAGGLPFRGGGGDSFRNVIITPDAGIAPDGTDDLAPIARYLADLVFDWEEAYHLPRKIKIGFTTAADAARAIRQDLGFVAVTGPSGTKGFKVYGGGGFGRNPALAVPLLDFIPAADVAHVARAMVELFNERGDRTNRGHARIRYIAHDLGEAAFRDLFLSYYNRVTAAFPPPPAFSSFPAQAVTSHPPQATGQSSAQSALFTAPTRFPGRVTVSLFVPNGDFTVDQFTAFAGVIHRFAVPELRLTMGPEILIPAFPESRLAEFHDACAALPIDLVFKSFAGHLATCVGATVCKMGVLDTPRLVAPVAAALDKYFAAHPAAFTADRVRAIIAALRFSGCPNSCTAHEAARFGFQGMKARVDGALTDGFYLWRTDNPAAPMGVDTKEFIPVAVLPARVLSLLAGAHIL